MRCCASVSTIIRVNAATTRSSRAATSLGASSGSSDSAAVSGWAAASRARWFGKYRYAVVREIDAASAAVLDRRCVALGDEVAGGGDERVPGASLLGDPTVQLVGS